MGNNDFKIVCKKCGKVFGEQDKDKNKSTKKWTYINKCECGGSFWPVFEDNKEADDGRK